MTMTSITPPIGQPATVSALPAAYATMAAALAALQSSAGLAAPQYISASGSITQGGFYLVTTAGITITLPSPTAWQGGKITILDWTGAQNPNITIAGTVNKNAGGTIFNLAGQGASFTAVPNDNSWAMT